MMRSGSTLRTLCRLVLLQLGAEVFLLREIAAQTLRMDMLALVDFRAYGDDNNDLDSWSNHSWPARHPCMEGEWDSLTEGFEGIKCTALNGRVNYVQLYQMPGLHGDVAEFSRLTELVHLKLSGSTSIHGDIGSLAVLAPTLAELKATSTSIAGGIEALAACTRLQSLTLTQTYIHGRVEDIRNLPWVSSVWPSFTSCQQTFPDGCQLAGRSLPADPASFAGRTLAVCCGTYKCKDNADEDGSLPQPDYPCPDEYHLKPDAAGLDGYDVETCCDLDRCAGNLDPDRDDHECLSGFLVDRAHQVFGADDETCCAPFCQHNVLADGPFAGETSPPDFVCDELHPLRPHAIDIRGYDRENCCVCKAGTFESADYEAGYRGPRPCDPCPPGTSSEPGSQGCNQCDSGEEAPYAGALCQVCKDGYMTDKTNNTVSTTSCTECPQAKRCVQGKCVVGSGGLGCASCDTACFHAGCKAERYFQMGQSCLPCPSGIGKFMMVMLGIATLLFLRGLWKITMVKTKTKEDIEREEELDDTRENAENLDNAVRAGSRITDTAIFMSISLPHIQFGSFAFQLPFGWPDFVRKFASYIAGMISLDFGLLTSPECANLVDSPASIYMTKFMLTHTCYIVLNLLLMVPKLTGHHRALHSTNAMIAIWTISLGPLVKSCVKAVDCTQMQMPVIDENGLNTTYTLVYRLDAMPDIECWSYDSFVFVIVASLAIIFLLFYAVMMPLILFVSLRKEKMKVSGDGDHKGFEGDFLESHGWLVLRYKPSRWYFEFFLVIYKIVVISASEMMKSLPIPLITTLAIVTGALFIVVFVDTPYRDSENRDGMSRADQLQILTLFSQLMNYGIGAYCLKLRTDRIAKCEEDNIADWDQGQACEVENPNGPPFIQVPDENDSYLTDKEEIVVAILCLMFLLGPLLPTFIRVYKKHHEADNAKREAAGDDAKSHGKRVKDGMKEHVLLASEVNEVRKHVTKKRQRANSKNIMSNPMLNPLSSDVDDDEPYEGSPRPSDDSSSSSSSKKMRKVKSIDNPMLSVDDDDADDDADQSQAQVLSDLEALVDMMDGDDAAEDRAVLQARIAKMKAAAAEDEDGAED